MQAFIAIAEADETVGKVVNIGSNYEISIADTARLIGEVMGAEVEIELDQGRLRRKRERSGAALGRQYESVGTCPLETAIRGPTGT